MADSSEEKRIGVPEAIYVGVITAAAYLGSYLYELSYLGTFGIPPEFVEVTIPTLVATGGCVLTLALLVSQLMGFMWQLDGLGFFHRDNGYGAFVKKWGLFILFGSVVAMIYKFTWYSAAPALLFAFSMVIDLVAPATLRGPGETYGHRLAKWLEEPERSEERQTMFRSKTARQVRGAIILITIFSFISMFLGSLMAKTRTSFGFVGDFPENVIIRKYGDKYLLVAYDQVSGKFIKQFRLVDVALVQEAITWRKIPGWVLQVEDGVEPSESEQ